VTGSSSSAPVQITNADLSGFRAISDNVWPMPTIDDAANGGINMVGQSYVTPTRWENYSQVQHDQYKDVTLTSSYMVSLGGVTAGADMKK